MGFKIATIRVLNGGHDIHEAIVRKRYIESANNLLLIKNHIDELYLIDNTEDYFRLQYSRVSGVNKTLVSLREAWADELNSKLANSY